MNRDQVVRGGAAAGGFAAVLVAAVALIQPWEGDGGRVGYLDIVGVPTYCYGGTGAGAVVGKRYTADECQGQLARDVARHADDILPCIHVAVPPESLGAFVSFAYNAGAANFCKSTMARKLNAGDLAGACAQLSLWVTAIDRRTGQRVRLKGLVNRRSAERAQCEKGLV